jgi:uncharacterized protein (TIGR03083 family)
MTDLSTDLAGQVAAAFDALADALAPLDDAAWDTPSLCAGWRVREVVAHMTMPARYDQPAYLAELELAAGDFTTLSETIARRDAALPSGTLVEQLRGRDLQQWTPPGGGELGALTHVVVHGLDATVPLGLGRPFADEAMCRVLDGLVAGGHQHFGVVLPDRLQATDLAWEHGTGTALRGSAADLVLRLTGRTVPG